MFINGLAKDGRIIYGKEDLDDILTGCDVDACNGAVITSDDGEVYAYFSTEFHPYGPGCFGPGNTPDEIMRMQKCSTNGRLCGALCDIYLNISILVVLALAYLF